MAVFLVPFIAILVGGAAVTGVGVGVIEAKKSRAANAARLEEAKNTANKLVDEMNRHINSGALYPAFRAYRQYIDLVVSNFDVAAEQKQTWENSYKDLRASAINKYGKLEAEYLKAAAAIEIDEEGDELYKVQENYLSKLEVLLGKEAPKIKQLKERFGANYQVHANGIATN